MNIGVATGEACQNRVMFKQFLMSGGMQFCQVNIGMGNIFKQFLISGGMQFCQVNIGMGNIFKHVPDVRRNAVLSGKYWDG